MRVYQAPTEACRAGPLRPRCTDSREGRRLNRHFDEEYRERARGYHGTPADQRTLRKRQVWVEPLFAEAKQWHGLLRFRLRGLANVNIEALLVAAGQNLKRWLQATGWGRRGMPGMASAVPAATPGASGPGLSPRRRHAPPAAALPPRPPERDGPFCKTLARFWDEANPNLSAKKGASRSRRFRT